MGQGYVPILLYNVTRKFGTPNLLIMELQKEDKAMLGKILTLLIGLVVGHVTTRKVLGISTERYRDILDGKAKVEVKPTYKVEDQSKLVVC